MGAESCIVLIAMENVTSVMNCVSHLPVTWYIIHSLCPKDETAIEKLFT